MDHIFVLKQLDMIFLFSLDLQSATFPTVHFSLIVTNVTIQKDIEIQNSVTWEGGKGITKKVAKSDIGRRMQPKKHFCSIKSFLFLIFLQLKFCFPVSQEVCFLYCIDL